MKIITTKNKLKGGKLSCFLCGFAFRDGFPLGVSGGFRGGADTRVPAFQHPRSRDISAGASSAGGNPRPSPSRIPHLASNSGDWARYPLSQAVYLLSGGLVKL